MEAQLQKTPNNYSAKKALNSGNGKGRKLHIYKDRNGIHSYTTASLKDCELISSVGDADTAFETCQKLNRRIANAHSL